MKNQFPNDEDAIEFMENFKLMIETYALPMNELIKKYLYGYGEIPTQQEHDEMYPGPKGKHQFTIFTMGVASITYVHHEMTKWDFKTNVFKKFSYPEDKFHPFLSFAYYQIGIR